MNIQPLYSDPTPTQEILNYRSTDVISIPVLYKNHLLDCQEIEFQNSMTKLTIPMIGNFGLDAEMSSQIVYQGQDLLFFSPIFKTYTLSVKLFAAILPLRNNNRSVAITSKIVSLKLPKLTRTRQIQFILSSRTNKEILSSQLFTLAPLCFSEHKKWFFIKNGDTLSLDKQKHLISPLLLKRHLFEKKFASVPDQQLIINLREITKKIGLPSSIMAGRIAEWLSPMKIDDIFQNPYLKIAFSTLQSTNLQVKIHDKVLPSTIERLLNKRKVAFQGLYVTHIPISQRNSVDTEMLVIFAAFKSAWENRERPQLYNEFLRARESGDILATASILEEIISQAPKQIASLVGTDTEIDLRGPIFSPLVMKWLIEFLPTYIKAPIKTIIDSEGNFFSRGIGAFLAKSTTLYVTCEKDPSRIPCYSTMYTYVKTIGLKKELCVIPTSIEAANLHEQYMQERGKFETISEYPKDGFDLGFVSSPSLRILSSGAPEMQFEENSTAALTTFLHNHVKKCWNEVREGGVLIIDATVYTRHRDTLNLAYELLPKIDKLLPDAQLLGIIPFYNVASNQECITPLAYGKMPNFYLMIFQKIKLPANTSIEKAVPNSSALDCIKDETSAPQFIPPRTPTPLSDDEMRQILSKPRVKAKKISTRSSLQPSSSSNYYPFPNLCD
jgi:hypothetical protein